ncbi:glycosyltransferase 87 family protein [Cupriavidus basilensis]
MPGLQSGGGKLPWLYPPTFLLPLLPLGLVPYGVAASIFLLGASRWYGWAMRRTLPWRSAWIAAMGFPGVAVAPATGQNSLWLGRYYWPSTDPAASTSNGGRNVARACYGQATSRHSTATGIAVRP